jgi:hypothetical protein
MWIRPRLPGSLLPARDKVVTLVMHRVEPIRLGWHIAIRDFVVKMVNLHRQNFGGDADGTRSIHEVSFEMCSFFYIGLRAGVGLPGSLSADSLIVDR